MNIYRLDPIDEEHPSWELSTEKECVWAAAATPKEARDLVAAKTRPDSGIATTPAHETNSPWQNAAVTSCVWEPSMTHVRAGTVVRADGSIVGD